MNSISNKKISSHYHNEEINIVDLLFRFWQYKLFSFFIIFICIALYILYFNLSDQKKTHYINFAPSNETGFLLTPQKVEYLESIGLSNDELYNKFQSDLLDINSLILTEENLRNNSIIDKNIDIKKKYLEFININYRSKPDQFDDSLEITSNDNDFNSKIVLREHINTTSKYFMANILDLLKKLENEEISHANDKRKQASEQNSFLKKQIENSLSNEKNRERIKASVELMELKKAKIYAEQIGIIKPIEMISDFEENRLSISTIEAGYAIPPYYFGSELLSMMIEDLEAKIKQIDNNEIVSLQIGSLIADLEYNKFLNNDEYIDELLSIEIEKRKLRELIIIIDDLILKEINPFVTYKDRFMQTVRIGINIYEGIIISALISIILAFIISNLHYSYKNREKLD